MSVLPELDIPRNVSKKQQIYTALLAKIQDHSLPVGTRLPNTATLAEEWKVAHATAHAALNELTREGWLVRYPKQGTFVSSPHIHQHTPKTKILTVVLPPRQDIIDSGNGDEVFEILQGLTEGSQIINWQVRIEPIPSFPSESDLKKAAQSICQSTAAAFMGVSQYASLIQKLTSQGLPVVTLVDQSSHGSAVIYDRCAAVKSGLEYLIDKGFKRIGYLGGKDAKLQYYLDTLKHYGMAQFPYTYPSRQKVRDLITQITQKPIEVEAFFIANYQIANALTHELRLQRYEVPSDLTLLAMGIESNHLSEIQLSYVRIPYLECGIEAIKLIAEQIEKVRPPQTIVLPSQLLLRGSTPSQSFTHDVSPSALL